MSICDQLLPAIDGESQRSRPPLAKQKQHTIALNRQAYHDDSMPGGKELRPWKSRHALANTETSQQQEKVSLRRSQGRAVAKLLKEAIKLKATTTISFNAKAGFGDRGQLIRDKLSRGSLAIGDDAG